MTIEVAQPVVEFLSFDRTTAGAKATGSITYLTGGTDGDTLTILDSQESRVYDCDEDAGLNEALSFPVFDSTWELKEWLEARLASMDFAIADGNVGAESTVTFTTGAPTDGAIVTVTDYRGNAISFEFSAAGDGTTGDVQVVKGAGQEACSDAFAEAVNTAFATLGPDGEPTITAVQSGTTTSVVTLTGAARGGLETQVTSDPVETVSDGNIACAVWGNSSLADGLTKTNLTASFKGTSGNETILESGNTFTVSGMSSGTNAVLTVGRNDTVGTPEFTMTLYRDGSIGITPTVRAPEAGPYSSGNGEKRLYGEEAKLLYHSLRHQVW